MKTLFTVVTLMLTLTTHANSLHPSTFQKDLAFNVVKAQRYGNRMPPVNDRSDTIKLQVIGKVGNCGEVYKAVPKVLNQGMVEVKISLDYVLEIYCVQNIQTEQVLNFEFQVPAGAKLKITNPIYTENYYVY